jgi:hypothetical protein
MSCDKRPSLLKCVDVKVCENASQLAFLIVLVEDINPRPATKRLTVLVFVRVNVCNLYPMPRVSDQRLD